MKAGDPSGIRSVHLRYRHLTQYEDYRNAPMIRDPAAGVYRARIPGGFITREWDFMYFIEAIDDAGNGAIPPDLKREAPYRVVRVAR